MNIFKRAKTGKERTASYLERMKRLGFKRTHVMVHVDDMADVSNYCRDLRRKRIEQSKGE